METKLNLDTSAILSLVISAAAFLTAIASPLITALIKCIHEKSMFKKRFIQKHKYEVIERYLKAVGKYAFSRDHKDISDFGEAAAEIFMYVPEELFEAIQNINTQISALSTYNDYNQRQELLQNLQKSYFDLCEKFRKLKRK